MSALGCAVLLTVLGLGQGQVTESDIQSQLYILSGVFGGILVVLLLMVVGLSCTIARLNHQVKEAAGGQSTGQSPGAKNSSNSKNYKNEPKGQPGYGPRREDISLDPAHNPRAEPRSRQPEQENNSSSHPPHHGQDYHRAEDRTSQYSSRRGEESRLPRLNYGQSRR
eukprot:GFUD01015545.1.p1 GENE.GFUD01015545.1~~GFUD01015545.1.p1  ORF type:complete len:167 (+),score=57.85 GFUD01015545.1:35-535(+)